MPNPDESPSHLGGRLAATVARVARALAIEPFDAREAGLALAPEGVDRTPPAGPAAASARHAHALLCLMARPTDGDVVFPLTLRRAELRQHGGQVSLPGGHPEPGESGLVAACREAEEEIALPADRPIAIGRLAPVWIPVSQTFLHVHVAHAPWTPLVAAPDEVAAVDVAPLAAIEADDAIVRETWTRWGDPVVVPFFPLCGWQVWGATAIALGELRARLRDP